MPNGQFSVMTAADSHDSRFGSRPLFVLTSSPHALFRQFYAANGEGGARLQYPASERVTPPGDDLGPKSFRQSVR
jgi:hypothetical protein